MGFASRLGRILTCLFLLPAVAPGLDLKTHARWEYAIGSAEQRPDDADSLRFATLPRFDRLERLVQGGIGYLWIRAVYQRPAELLGKEAAILTGAAIVADETFLDGEKIGSGGRFPPAFFNDWNDVRVWRLPPAAFPKTDTLLIRLYVHHQGAIGSVVEIGEASSFGFRQRLGNFFGKELNMALALLLAMISLHHLLIFARRRKDVYHRNFALLCISFSVYLSNFFASSIPGVLDSGMSYLVFQKIVFTSMSLAVFAMGLFVARFLGRDEPEWFRHLYAILFALVAMLYLGAPDFGVFNMLRQHLGIVLVVPVGYILFAIADGLHRRKREARTILLGFAPLFLGAIFDLVVREWMRVPGFYVSGFGAPAFIVAMLFALSLRFVNDANEIEHLKQELELEVLVRTNQLKEANLHLEKSMLEVVEANRRLEGLVVTDPLTMALNRRAFELRFEEEFLRARRNHVPLSILMVDIDHFKNVNDVHGHLCGDHCLAAVSSRLQEALKRSSDVLARFGGEEFVVLLPDTDEQGAKRIAEKLRLAIEAMETRYEDKIIPLTISVGVHACIPDMTTERSALLASADGALYEAKAKGRNRVEVAGAEQGMISV